MEEKNEGQGLVDEIISQLKNNEVRLNITKRFLDNKWLVKCKIFWFEARPGKLLSYKYKFSLIQNSATVKITCNRHSTDVDPFVISGSVLKFLNFSLTAVK